MKDGLPVALGYLAVSFTLGIAAVKSGLTPFQAFATSALNNTSAGEFAAFSLIGAGVSYMEIALTTLILNMRYILMSCALSQKIDKNTPIVHRFLMAYDVTDEIFGLSIMSEGRLDPKYTYGLITISAPSWAIGTYLGAVMGSVMPAGVLSAMNLALYGMFIAVIVPPAKKDKTIAVVIAVSMLSSLMFSILPGLREISSGIVVIILTVVISLAAAILFPVCGDKKEKKEVVGCEI
ncbi:MAG: AzlC family ABC transporter permease [Clostridiales bacterium]|nr:AzlC family ABC transporter permease [Clostridiales bacterium]